METRFSVSCLGEKDQNFATLEEALDQAHEFGAVRIDQFGDWTVDRSYGRRVLYRAADWYRDRFGIVFGGRIVEIQD